jgi:hypothetical protein
LDGGAADSLYTTQFHASLCLRVADMGGHSTGGGIYQTALATCQTLAVSVKQLPYHFISSAADNCHYANRHNMDILGAGRFYVTRVLLRTQSSASATMLRCQVHHGPDFTVESNCVLKCFYAFHTNCLNQVLSSPPHSGYPWFK